MAVPRKGWRVRGDRASPVSEKSARCASERQLEKLVVARIATRLDALVVIGASSAARARARLRGRGAVG